MTQKRIHLIRHGQTDWNMAGRWQGFEAVPLNETGLAQARALATWWQTPLNTLYSSDLSRAWQTAEILGEAVGLRPTPDTRLREFHLGIFQGLTWAEMQAQYPAETDAFNADYMGYPVPKGESRYQLQARAFAAWQEITAHDPGPDIALVSHGGTIKVLLFRLFGETPELHRLRIDNTAVTTLVNDSGAWRIGGLAETPHLAQRQTDQDRH